MITILEVLFIKKSDRERKKDLLAKRVSNFIESNDKDIEEVNRNISDLYKLRNDVVHSGAEVLRENLNMIRYYKIRLIKEYMELLSVQ